MVPILLAPDKCILDVVNRAGLKENEEVGFFKVYSETQDKYSYVLQKI